MIALAASRAHAAPRKARHELVKIHGDIEHHVYVGHFFERLRLVNVAREPIEHKALLAIGLFEPLRHDLASHFVGHQLPFIDIRFGFQPHRRALFQIFTKDVARGNVHDTVLFGDLHGLRAFARARSAQ